MPDLERMADGVIVAARDFVTRSLAPVRKQLTELVEMAAALDKRVSAIQVVKGDPGASAYQIACLGGFRGSEGEWLESLKGKSAGPVEMADFVRDYISGYVDTKLLSIPAPEKVDYEQIAAGVKHAVADAVSALPAATPGKDADPELVRSLVAQAVAEIPKPENGKSITQDDVAPILEAAVAKWALDFERRASDLLQRSVDRLPKPKDGADALGFDDLSVDYDGERTFTFKFQCGERCKEFSFKVPLVLERGVFKPDKAYERGDGVTYGGSWYIAQKDAPEGKPGFGGDWRLAVKRGQDGRDGAVVPLKGPEVVRLR